MDLKLVIGNSCKPTPIVTFLIVYLLLEFTYFIDSSTCVIYVAVIYCRLMMLTMLATNIYVNMEKIIIEKMLPHRFTTYDYPFARKS